MDKEFVPYKQALELKELGFNERCFGYYLYNMFQFFDDVRSGNTNSEFKSYPTAPTFSQAFRWFREKHGLFATIDGLEERLYYKITQTNEYSKEYNTYEEAELACLIKLIEIVKNK